METETEAGAHLIRQYILPLKTVHLVRRTTEEV